MLTTEEILFIKQADDFDPNTWGHVDEDGRLHL